METKVCKCCGKELPIEKFKKGMNHGKPFVMSICEDCLKQRQKEGHAKRREAIKQNQEDAVNNAKCARLQDFTPRELMRELSRRGYEGTITYTETHTINLGTIR